MRFKFYEGLRDYWKKSSYKERASAIYIAAYIAIAWSTVVIPNWIKLAGKKEDLLMEKSRLEITIEKNK